MADLLKLGVLISGSGTNLQSIIDHIEKGSLKAVIKIVISNNPDTLGITRAKNHGIPFIVLKNSDFKSKEDFDSELIKVLKDHNVDLVILAGFMRIISPAFLKAFVHKIMNIHPALLPSFPGLHGQKQAVDYGVKISGCTVHFVDDADNTDRSSFKAPCRFLTMIRKKRWRQEYWLKNIKFIHGRSSFLLMEKLKSKGAKVSIKS